MLKVLFLCMLLLSVVEEKRILSSLNSLEVPFSLNSLSQPQVKACFGTEPQCFHLKVVTNINESYLFHAKFYDSGFDPKKSSTFHTIKKEQNFSHTDLKYKAIVCSDVLTFLQVPTIKIPDFSFYLVTEGRSSMNEYDGVLGLGNYYDDLNYSIIQKFISSGIITQRIFSLRYDKENRVGIIKFGSHNEQLSNKLFRTVSLNEGFDTPSFEATMDAIIYFNSDKLELTDTYNTPQRVLFSPGANRIFCPKGFFDYFINEVLRKIEGVENICNLDYEVDNDEFGMINCREEILDLPNLGELKFIFGKWSATMKIKDMFIGSYETKVLSLTMLKTEKIWLFGYTFLKEYFTIFNAENSSVSIGKVADNN